MDRLDNQDTRISSVQLLNLFMRISSDSSYLGRGNYESIRKQISIVSNGKEPRLRFLFSCTQTKAHTKSAATLHHSSHKSLREDFKAVDCDSVVSGFRI